MGIVHWADGTIFDLEKIREKTKDNNALLILMGLSLLVQCLLI